MFLEVSDLRFAQQFAPEIKSGYFASIEFGDLYFLTYVSKTMCSLVGVL